MKKYRFAIEGVGHASRSHVDNSAESGLRHSHSDTLEKRNLREGDLSEEIRSVIRDDLANDDSRECLERGEDKNRLSPYC